MIIKKFASGHILAGDFSLGFNFFFSNFIALVRFRNLKPMSSTYLRMLYVLHWCQSCIQLIQPIHLYLSQKLHKISFYHWAVDKRLEFHWNRMETLQICYNSIEPLDKWPNFDSKYFFLQYPFCIHVLFLNTQLFHNLYIQQPFRGRKSKHIRRYRTIPRNLALKLRFTKFNKKQVELMVSLYSL